MEVWFEGRLSEALCCPVLWAEPAAERLRNAWKKRPIPARQGGVVQVLLRNENPRLAYVRAHL